VKPAQRRAAVGYAQERFGLSPRRACRLVRSARSTIRYQRRGRGADEALRARLKELAVQRPRFGYRRLHILLRREGIVVNHKRIARLYREEGLAVRRRIRKSLTSILRGRPAPPQRANAQGALDCLQDALAAGRKLRVLNGIDVFTREALALEVDTSWPGSRVVRVLERLCGQRERPAQLVLANGPELISRALEEWAHQHAVPLPFIDPGQPIPNAHGERFHGRLRDACLNEHWLLGIGDARQIVETWRQDDKQARPPSALGYQTPVECAQGAGRAAASLPADDGLSSCVDQTQGAGHAHPQVHDSALFDQRVINTLDEAVMDDYVVSEVLPAVGLDVVNFMSASELDVDNGLFSKCRQSFPKNSSENAVSNLRRLSSEIKLSSSLNRDRDSA
jgi:putative transposase